MPNGTLVSFLVKILFSINNLVIAVTLPGPLIRPFKRVSLFKLSIVDLSSEVCIYSHHK